MRKKFKERRKHPRFKKIYWIYFGFIELLLMIDIFEHAHADVQAKIATPFMDSDYIIKGLLVIIGFFIIRFMYRADRNQSLLFQRQNEFNTRLSSLEGKHEQAMADGRCGKILG